MNYLIFIPILFFVFFFFLIVALLISRDKDQKFGPVIAVLLITDTSLLGIWLIIAYLGLL